MKTVVLIITLVSIVSALRCPLQWSLFESNCYKYFSQGKKFWEASSFCRLQSFHINNTTRRSELISIHSYGENLFVNSLVPPGIRFIIGLYLDERGEEWKWTDQTPRDYTNWAPNQPDNWRDIQDFGVMWNTRAPTLWDDSSITQNHPFVCKVPAGDDCIIKPTDELSCRIDEDCMNGGSCNSNGKCTCQSGYTCIDCSLYDGCQSNPCKFGGTCVSNKEMSFYTCICPEGSAGLNCEVITDACKEGPCQNSGTCLSTTEEPFYTCACAWPWTGTICEQYNGCSSNPCVNSGTCSSWSGTFTCECDSGYLGKLCEIYDVCRNNPCLSAGTCVSNDGIDYSCDCPEGFSGNNCEITPDVCSNVPCQNSGTCLPTNEEPFYACACGWPWKGMACELYDGCSSNPCMNSGTCSNGNGPFTCECEDGYLGTFCEVCDDTKTSLSEGSNNTVGVYVLVPLSILLIIAITAIISVFLRKRHARHMHGKTENLICDDL